MARLVLRQEKTGKLRLNAKLGSSTLSPNSGNDKSWVVMLEDWSEGKAAA